MAKKDKYTIPEVIAALQETKGMQFLAAKRLGCSHDTIRNYILRYPQIKAVLDAQRGEMVDLSELKLWQSIQNGEQWGITLCLKTLGKERGYVERHEQTGKDGAPLLVLAHRYGAAARNGHAVEVSPEPAERGTPHGD